MPIILRPYRKSDSEACFTILEAKGVKPDGMEYEGPNVETHIMEDEGKMVGFFTLVPLRKVYALRHFCTVNGNLHATRLMERFMRFTLLQKGCPIIVIGINKENKRLQEMVEYQYGKKPYAEKEGQVFYNVNILEAQNG